MAGPTALLDANVLYPAGLRDLLLRLADRYLFAPLWRADIHAEWMRSLLADRPDIDAGVLHRTARSWTNTSPIPAFNLGTMTPRAVCECLAAIRRAEPAS